MVRSTITNGLAWIKRWIQKKDDELLYDPDGVMLGEDGVYVEEESIHREGFPAGDPACQCVHCRLWRDEVVDEDNLPPEYHCQGYVLDTADLENQPFAEVFGTILRRINQRNGHGSP